MNGSESIINDLLIEVDLLTYRSRSIKQCLSNSLTKRLQKRLIDENNSIFDRVEQIQKIAIFFNNISIEEINFSSLLIEKCKRSLIETQIKKNLFYL